MRILHVADLHYRRSWFEWVIAQSRCYDLTCIAGDLLFDVERFRAQASLPDWSSEGATPRRPVQLDHIRSLFEAAENDGELGQIAVCSGNHDIPALWDFDLGIGTSRLTFATDMRSAQLANAFYVSALPFWSTPREFAEKWKTEAAQAAGRQWIVLCHVGPRSSRIVEPALEEQPLRSCIEMHPPWIVLSGHFHRTPFRRSTSWYDRLGATCVFNCGSQDFRDPPVSIPPHIVIESAETTATWQHSDAGIATVETVALDRRS